MKRVTESITRRCCAQADGRVCSSRWFKAERAPNRAACQLTAAFSISDSGGAHCLRSILRAMHRATCICLFRSSSHRAWLSYSPTSFVLCSRIGLCSMS
jgi:hypothetical protein